MSKMWYMGDNSKSKYDTMTESIVKVKENTRGDKP